LNRGDQKGMVTAPQAPRSIRRSQQGLDLGPSQKAHKGAALWGKGQQSLAPPQPAGTPSHEQCYGLKLRVAS
jgi:hypothetical protein